MKGWKLLLLFGMVGVCISCLEDEQPPYSDGEDSGFYIQIPGDGVFYVGSEVLLKGNDLLEVTNVYVQGKSDISSDDSGWSDVDGDGVLDEFPTVEARIVNHTDTELIFILPLETKSGSTAVYYKRGEELEIINVLNNIVEPSVGTLYDEMDGYSIVIRNVPSSKEDKVYLQVTKYDYDLGGTVPISGEWEEASILFCEEHSVTVKPTNVGCMNVLYMHGGEKVQISGQVDINPADCICFLKGNEYEEGDEVAIIGGFFREGDAITLNSRPVEIVSIDMEKDELIFRIPQGCVGTQKVSLHRYLLEYPIATISCGKRIDKNQQY